MLVSIEAFSAGGEDALAFSAAEAFCSAEPRFTRGEALEEAQGRSEDALR